MLLNRCHSRGAIRVVKCLYRVMLPGSAITAEAGRPGCLFWVAARRDRPHVHPVKAPDQGEKVSFLVAQVGHQLLN
ncbi:MAG: hypothetical protein EBU88_11085 [Acidobacteria bacterium]|nr:hypothetical protein [Acidobacteriota bacterium]